MPVSKLEYNTKSKSQQHWPKRPINSGTNSAIAISHDFIFLFCVVMVRSTCLFSSVSYFQFEYLYPSHIKGELRY